jgi:hypothetical protein
MRAVSRQPGYGRAVAKRAAATPAPASAPARPAEAPPRRVRATGGRGGARSGAARAQAVSAPPPSVSSPPPLPPREEAARPSRRAPSSAAASEALPLRAFLHYDGGGPRFFCPLLPPDPTRPPSDTLPLLLYLPGAPRAAATRWTQP